MEGILGKKVGMTQIFLEDGQVVPVTVVKAGPCLVVQRKTTERDGYEAVQVGLVEESAPRKVTQARAGHFAKAGVPATRRLAEFPVAESGEEVKAGDQFDASIFAPDDSVEVVGTSKGKGFQGVIKRHGFGGGRATHGSMFHRAPGSIGQSAWPSRVLKGVRLPGQMGSKRITVRNVTVVKVDPEQNLLYLKGAVPGAKNSYLAIRRTRKG